MKARKKHVLVTAGPTREYLDPVRFLSNPSTGKMGFAVAEAALLVGCSVDLISGPVTLDAPEGVALHEVVSAQEMFSVAKSLFERCDFFISVAAVSDWGPTEVTKHKIKKTYAEQVIKLHPNPDILATLAADRRDNQTVIGFCAETEDLESHALTKLKAKRLDWIAGNLVGKARVGFQSESNELLVLNARGGRHVLGPGPKLEVAQALVQLIGLES